MRPDPSAVDYDARLTQAYGRLNYGRSLVGYVMRQGHKILERPFTHQTHFGRVLEVGSGAGEHLAFVAHGFDEYRLTDWNDARLSRAYTALPEDLRAKVHVAAEDASTLSLEDGSVDRLIACHILEHLYRPHEVLREWYRVLRPNGVMSILLPCDPGMLWRAGRLLGPRANASRVGIEYDYWMAREHVNPINNLVVFIRYYFDNLVETWYPARVPLFDLNLFYICHITRKP